MSSQPLAPSDAVAERLDRFRAFMARFNPVTPASAVMKDWLVVEGPSQPTPERLAARAILDVGSQRLLVGGIGSGKSTRLLLAARWLTEQSKAAPFYIDITAETDLSRLNSGALLASLGLHLIQVLKNLPGSPNLPEPVRLDGARDALRGFAYGRLEHRQPIDQSLFRELQSLFTVQEVRTPGKLSPPLPALERDLEGVMAPLGLLVEAVRGCKGQVVAVIDGLDRLLAAERFWNVAEQDLRALRRLEVSVLAAAPLSLLFGEGRQISDYFEDIYHLPPVAADPNGSRFLMEVLHRRGGEELLQEAEAVDILCRASGGVLRDLMSLVRNAAEEAYIDGGETIERGHVDSAVRRLGQGYLLGLGAEERTALLALHRTGSFALRAPANLELLLTRRVLEYPPDRFVVHPCLLPLLTGR